MEKGICTTINSPVSCNICGDPATVDGKTIQGPWAFMCSRCFGDYGIGFGTGRGQLLVVEPITKEMRNAQ